MVNFSVKELLVDQGVLILSVPAFDYDRFPPIGDALIALLSAKVIEKQQDADIHTWLIDFDGQVFFLKAEHYAQALWLEALDKRSSAEELTFIARLIEHFA
jgi:hypothetical protein